MTILPLISGTTDSHAIAINNSGQVLGYCQDITDGSYGPIYTFLYSGGTLNLFPSTESIAAGGINDKGQIVGGLASGQLPGEFAFLYSNGSAVDLNSLIDPTSGCYLEFATAINNLGQIVGIGTLNGSDNAFLLTPTNIDQEIITQQPSSALTNQPLQVTVTTVAPNGNVDTNYNGYVTLGIGSSTGSATLVGTTTVQAFNGIAAFGDLAINGTGTYTLVARGTNVAGSPKSQPIDIRDQVVFSPQPPDSVLNDEPFDLTMAAEDYYGHIDPNYAGSVTAALASATGVAMLAGTTTLQASSGGATFDDLTLNAVGTYTLAISGDYLVTSQKSDSVDVYDQSLIFIQPPDQLDPNDTFEIQAAAADYNWQLDSNYSGNMTVAIATKTSTATLDGTTTVQAIGGVDDFNHLFFTGAGTFTLVVSGDYLDDSDPSTPVTQSASGIIFPRPPEVIDVLVDGTAWSGAFLRNLQNAYVGNGTGYAIPVASSDQLKPLPAAVNQILIAFDENVNVQENSLTVTGKSVANYVFSNFSYNTTTHVATWTLAEPIGADNVSLDLRSTGPHAVTGALGASLDGEWADGVSTYPSGNGAAGGDFTFTFNVLPGDVNQDGIINSQDIAVISSNWLQTNSLAADVNGDGIVNTQDLAIISSGWLNSLPANGNATALALGMAHAADSPSSTTGETGDTTTASIVFVGPQVLGIVRSPISNGNLIADQGPIVPANDLAAPSKDAEALPPIQTSATLVATSPQLFPISGPAETASPFNAQQAFGRPAALVGANVVPPPAAVDSVLRPFANPSGAETHSLIDVAITATVSPRAAQDDSILALDDNLLSLLAIGRLGSSERLITESL